MKNPKVVFFKDAKKKWRWSLVAANGRKLCTPGESFSSKFKAEQNYELVATLLFNDRLNDSVNRVYE
jgi:uncharacterized protein YegP (UPF0339 family)